MRLPIRFRTAGLPMLMIAGAAALSACSAMPRPGSAGMAAGATEGVASYYADRYAGRATASGEPYDPGAMTAAHRDLPFGTRVRVTDADTGRSVTVRINDRGPFVAGRVIDLSRAAAEQLDMIRRGLAPVHIVLID